MAISTLLLGSLASLTLVATRALPTGRSDAERTLAAAAAVDQLTADLTYATAITNAHRNAITFTVPDRTGDGVADSIQYAWSAASPPSPLYRAVNGGEPAAIVSDVRDFALAYDLASISTTTSTPSTAAESTLASADPTLLTSLVVPNGTNAFGQTFRPGISAGSTFTITRAAVRLRDRGGQDGVTRLEIRVCDPATGLPTGPRLASATIDERTLNSLTSWRTVTFRGLVALPANTTFALLVSSAVGTEPSELVVRTDVTSSANQRYITSTNGGASWTVRSTGVMNFQVFGTVTTTTSVGTTTQTLERVALRLRTTEHATPLHAAARTLNRPTMPAAP